MHGEAPIHTSRIPRLKNRLRDKLHDALPLLEKRHFTCIHVIQATYKVDGFVI